MKRIISTLFIGALGGVFALVGNHYFSAQTNTNQLNYNPYSAAIHLTSSNANHTATSGIDFVMAAEKSINSVVHIKTIVENNNNLSYDPFQDWLFGGRQRQPNQMQGSGSGVIISQDGYIVTNNHVVKDATKIEIVLNDKRSFIADVIGTDPTTDLALLKVKVSDLPFASYGNSDLIKIGEWVLAVGNPLNLNSTVTAGIISAKGRNINILENNQGALAPIESFLQTDAAVNPGNSGGALVNTAGELIGINTAIASNNGSYQGYSFAIPVNIVKKVVADLIEYGSVQRAYIGLSIRDIDSKMAEEKNISQLNGVYVNGLTANGAGELAGIKIGDVVTKIENVEIKSTAELLEQIAKFRPSDKINVSINRNGKEIILPIQLKNKENDLGVIKKPEIVKTSVTNLGAEFEELNAEELSKYRLQHGIRIKRLQPGKLLNAGIKEGYIITAIDKRKISTIKDLLTFLETKSGGILIEGVYENGMRAYYGFGM